MKCSVIAFFFFFRTTLSLDMKAFVCLFVFVLVQNSLSLCILRKHRRSSGP